MESIEVSMRENGIGTVAGVGVEHVGEVGAKSVGGVEVRVVVEADAGWGWSKGLGWQK